MEHYTAPLGAGQIAPLASYWYFDKTQIWLKKPLGARLLSRIAAHCRGGDGRPSRVRCRQGRDGSWQFHSARRDVTTSEPLVSLYAHNESGSFDFGYQQRLDLFQPTRKALELLAAMTKRDAPMINYVEFAYDFIFDDQDAANQPVEFCRDHLVQSWHRKSMKPDFYQNGIDGIGFTTRSMPKNRRTAGHWIKGYSSLECRITGELNCFHVEGIYSSVKAVRRIGIYTLSDLIDFDFDAYFKKHMTFYETIDLERLGRFHRNRISGSKSRQSRIERMGKSGNFLYNPDYNLGMVLYLSLSLDRDDIYKEPCLQTFVDNYASLYGVSCRPILVPIPCPFIDRGKSITSHETIAAQSYPATQVEQHRHPSPTATKTQQTPVSQPLLASSSRRKSPPSLQTPKTHRFTPRLHRDSRVGVC